MSPTQILSTLFSSLSEVRDLSTASEAESYFQKIKFVYGSECVPLTAAYSPACLEVYGLGDVPKELIVELTAALHGAKYERYNQRTHYWSGKVIDDLFQNDDLVFDK